MKRILIVVGAVIAILAPFLGSYFWWPEPSRDPSPGKEDVGQLVTPEPRGTAEREAPGKASSIFKHALSGTEVDLEEDGAGYEVAPAVRAAQQKREASVAKPLPRPVAPHRPGKHAVVSGGESNTAAGVASVVAGGANNVAGKWDSTVSGGRGNSAAALAATIGGGRDNRAEGVFATVDGGRFNVAGGIVSVVGGGVYNEAAQQGGTVSGGLYNKALAEGAAIGGGKTNVVSGDYGVLSGGMGNRAAGHFTVVAGGKDNVAEQDHVTIAGGVENRGAGLAASIGGGMSNLVERSYGVVAGGRLNFASGVGTAIGGGIANAALGSLCTVAGGWNNIASGAYATIPGGRDNIARGQFSFAAGRFAMAVHDGAFVWADNTGPSVQSDRINQFKVRASGGVVLQTSGDGIAGVRLPAGGNAWSVLSSERVKTQFTAIDPGEVLQQLDTVPIHRWTLRSQDPDTWHLGPTAEDFHRAFGLGERPDYINSGDIDGVALAAIQGLHRQVAEQQALIRTLARDNERLSEKFSTLEAKLGDLLNLDL